VGVRTATLNMLRGLLYEFGVLLPGGKKAELKTMSALRAQVDDQLPQLMRRLVDLQLETLKGVERSINQLEAEIAKQQRQIGQARTLREVPGIGVLGATALAGAHGLLMERCGMRLEGCRPAGRSQRLWPGCGTHWGFSHKSMVITGGGMGTKTREHL
jgi:transposase